MRIKEIISHKRDGLELTDEEIRYFIKGYVSGEIKDYHASALLMAIYIRGMSDRETVTLTQEMAESGDMLDLSEIGGITADKHSTGGVGDKTTLIVAPIVAAAGVKIAKMSGRGLGHTGGTVDKLESIEGFNVALSPEKFISQVKNIGISVVGQTGNLAPADKKIYALRDATETVGSIPLIASSIMSKKLAAGAHCIVLDVKTGSGAFMKTPEDAEKLSEKMITIGKNSGRKIAAVITDMDTPLGKNIGNTLEIAEAIEVLNNKGSADLREVSIVLASNILSLAMDISEEKSREIAEETIKSGSALKKFKELIGAQGGNTKIIETPELLPKASVCRKISAAESGFINSMNAETIGNAAMLLGAGRAAKEDSIDYTSGIILLKKTGDKVEKGEAIAELYTNDEKKIRDAEKLFLSALSIKEAAPENKPLIYKIIK